MFEAIILLALLGIILLIIITGGHNRHARKASFIDLAAELKTSVRKSNHKWRS